MIEPRSRLSVVRQCDLVAVSRSSVYYRARPCPHDDLELMRHMDEQYLRTPFYGSRLAVNGIEEAKAPPIIE
jgi:putative transposase